VSLFIRRDIGEIGFLGRSWVEGRMTFQEYIWLIKGGLSAGLQQLSRC
jgi:hypothetical protein